MNNLSQRLEAKKFASAWENKGYEKGETQQFWTELLVNVYGLENPSKYIEFEKQVKIESQTKYIDVYLNDTMVMIEQKSIDKDLSQEIVQSGGTKLTPFKQAWNYSNYLPLDEKPRWIITCNFKEFQIHDMNKPNEAPEVILLKDFEKEYYRLSFLVNKKDEMLQKEMEVSMKAGDIVGVLYDKLKEQYANPDDEETLKSLNILCVRLVFCLYAEDAGIFGRKNMFHDLIECVDERYLRETLIQLFKVLDTKEDERDPYLDKELLEFPYVNGGLFADEHIEIPRLTEEIKQLIINDASLDFDWSEISPTIFGAVFESTLNPETRRKGGMHYTSIENIHKVIDPLFLNDLKEELAEIKNIGVAKTKKIRLEEFHNKIANIFLFDPSLGSGNFMTESYLSLRKLENEIIEAELEGQISMGILNDNTKHIRVSISQFYGIEINDFAVTVAKTALWIAESQMMKKTEEIIHMPIDFLPLKTYANIVEGNALTIDWNDVAPKDKISYITGNPPFVGARFMSSQQKEELIDVFGDKWNNVGNLDYVSCWYKKAADYMKGTNIEAALVSTNSICQGESVANLWKPLIADGISINFAYRTFRWDSEASIIAHVHCIIIGFSYNSKSHKIIFDGNNIYRVTNINGYLLDAQNVFIESRNKPLCNVPNIGIGNKPIDDGNYLFSKEEMEEFILQEPKSKNLFKPFYGSREFINGSPRYCLWLGDSVPNELKSMPLVMDRISKVREFRLKSKSAGTVKLADKPTHFHVENIPNDNYLIIPRVSSESRKYIPIGYMDKESMASDSVHILSNATLFQFGILTSNVHMAWMRAIAGRLKSDYRYSKDIVYNNFPWPSSTDEQKRKIEETAQGILDARALYPDSTLADLYDPRIMPDELRKAHQENDKAVLKAYGFPTSGLKFGEADCVAELMKMYQKLTKGNGIRK